MIWEVTKVNVNPILDIRNITKRIGTDKTLKIKNGERLNERDEVVESEEIQRFRVVLLRTEQGRWTLLTEKLEENRARKTLNLRPNLKGGICPKGT